MSFEYKKEFFDRTYTAREAYARVWGYARKYKFRIVVGIVCGMLTAGTLIPMLSLVQPALAKVEQREEVKSKSEKVRSFGSLLNARPRQFCRGLCHVRGPLVLVYQN